MSERPPTMLTLSTQNLSADGVRVVPGENEGGVEVTEAAALAALKAFASLPAMELVDVDAKIYLVGPRGKVAVQNVRGKLFVANMPEAMNPAAERTPEQTIQQLTANSPAMAASAANAEAAPEAEVTANVAGRSGGWRGALNSGWTLAAFLAVAAIVAYVTLAPETPDGVEIVRDPVRISALNAEFNGRYGEPTVTVLVLDNGKLAGKQTVGTGRPEEQIFEKAYRFGLRDAQVVLVVDNGALLEPQPDHGLKYLESIYPRLAK